MKTEILFDPVDFFMSKPSIIRSTCPDTVGERKNEEFKGLISNFPFASFLLK